MSGSFNTPPLGALPGALMYSPMSKETILAELDNLVRYAGLTPSALLVIQQARNYIINDGWIFGEFHLSVEDTNYLNGGEPLRRGLPTVFHSVRDEAQQELHRFYAILNDGLNIQPHPVKAETVKDLKVIQVTTSKAGAFLQSAYMKMRAIPDWETIIEEWSKQPRW